MNNKLFKVFVAFCIALSTFSIVLPGLAAGENTLDSIILIAVSSEESFEAPISMGFDSEQTFYSMGLINEFDSVRISATKTDSAATMKINDEEIASGVDKTINLEAGDNTVTIAVTPTEGEAKTYTVVINRNTTPTEDINVVESGLVRNLVKDPGFEDTGWTFSSGRYSPWPITPPTGVTRIGVWTHQGATEIMGVRQGDQNGNQFITVNSYTVPGTGEVRTVDYPHTGNHAVRVGGRERYNTYTSLSESSYMNQSIPVEEGESYIFSFWMGYEEGTRAIINVVATNAAGNDVGNNYIFAQIDATTEGYDQPDTWYNFKGLVTIPQGQGITNIKFNVPSRNARTSTDPLIQSTSSALYDDFMLAKVHYAYTAPRDWTTGLEFSVPGLDPEFDFSLPSNQQNYVLPISYSQDNVHLTVTTETPDDIASVTVNGNPATVNVPYHITNLPLGGTLVVVEVEGVDYIHKEFRITINRRISVLLPEDGEFVSIFRDDEIPFSAVGNITVSVEEDEEDENNTAFIRCVTNPAGTDNYSRTFSTVLSPMNLSESLGYAALTARVRYSIPMPGNDFLFGLTSINEDGNATTAEVFTSTRSSSVPVSPPIPLDQPGVWHTVTIPLTVFTTTTMDSVPFYPEHVTAFKFRYWSANGVALDELTVDLDDIAIIDIRPSITVTANGTPVLDSGSAPAGATELSVTFGEPMNVNHLSSDYIALKKDGVAIPNLQVQAVGNTGVTITLEDPIEMFVLYSLELILPRTATGQQAFTTINFMGGGTGQGVKQVVFKKGANIAHVLTSGLITAEVTAVNNEETPSDVVVLIGHYDSRRALKNCNLEISTIPESDNGHLINVELDVRDVVAGDFLMVMMWDTVESMTAKSGIYELKTTQ